MIPENDIKKQLSLAYIQIISSFAGMSYEMIQNDYGIDIQIQDVQKFFDQLIPTGYNLDIQAKSTFNFKIENGNIKYRLRNKNYNDLCLISPTPRILVLFCLPKIKGDWIMQNHDVIELRKCAYWHVLSGNNFVENKDNKTLIEIPQKRIFSVENLLKIFEKIKIGGRLDEL